MLFGSRRADEIMGVLDAAGYRRVLDVPAIPTANVSGLRYATTVPVLPGPVDWYLRSFGVPFDLVNRRWRRQSQRWYSLGWGVVDDVAADELLLVQAWPRTPSELAGELAAVRGCARRYVEDVDATGCIRVAAVLDRPEGAADG